MSSAAATGECEATRQKKKNSKLKHVEVGVAPSQSLHVSKLLPAAPSLQTPAAQSPAPGTPILEEAAAAVMRKKEKIRKEHKGAALLLPRNHNLEEAVMATMKKKQKRKERKRVEITLPYPSTSAAETPILEQDEKVTKKRKRRMEQHSAFPPHPADASKPLHAAPFLQSPAPEILTLQQAAAMMRERKVRKEQKVDELPFAPNPTSEEEQGEEALMTMMRKKERKPVEQILVSPSTSVAAETPIQVQEVKLIKKQKQRRLRRGQEPSGNSAVPFHPGHACNSLLAAPLLQSPAPEILTLEEAAAMMRKRKMLKEQKVDALSFPQNPTLEEQEKEAMMATKKKDRKRVEQILSSPSTYVAAETPIQEQEVRVIKKQKQRRGQEPSCKSQEPSGNLLLPLHPDHACNSLLAAPLLQSPAPEILTLEEAAAMMRKRKMLKEQKVDALPFAQNPTLEEQGEEAMMMTKKKDRKRVEQILSSPSTPVAAETPVQEQEVKLTKKQKQQRGLEPSGKSQEPSSNLPLPLHAGHASMPLLAAPSLQPPAPEILTLGEAAAMMRKRKMHKEQKVPALSFYQNPTLEEEQGKKAMKARMKERNRVEQILSSPSTSGAAETPIHEQEVKVTKKQNQRRGQEPSGESPLPLDPGQTRCVQPERAKAPPEQEGENDGCKGITKINGKKPSIRVLSKRELIQEARKQQWPLPEGCVSFSDFVASCTEQNPDHSSPYSAFFDQFCYNPVCGDRKPPLPRTPDCLEKLPPRGYSSFGSSQLAANETSREKKQRNPSGKSRLPFDPSQTCCVQLQGTKAPPEQDQNTDAPKVNNIGKSNSKKACARAPIKRELFKGMVKEQALTEGFLAPKDFVPNYTEQSPNYSSPSGASFDQLCYRSARQDLNPQLPRSTDRLSKLPPRHYPSFESSELTASETSKAFKANSSVTSKSKKKDSGSGSSLGSQKKLNVKEKTTPQKTPRTRKPPPVFTTAEKRSDKYRRVPLDQLVPPPRSPYNLLQENHASDPWRVIIICMFLNLTQGIQVERILEGFFDRYPDARSALNADPDKMAEYLAPQGLQHVKTRNILKFSKQYVEENWTHITELCGVGKYAADAYAIFCAGRATEVVPEDHKLLDYWNYVCFELPMTQIRYNSVPHPKLVEYKKGQNWVTKSGDHLVFPGGGTQFKDGVARYIQFVEHVDITPLP